MKNIFVAIISIYNKFQIFEYRTHPYDCTLCLFQCVNRTIIRKKAKKKKRRSIYCLLISLVQSPKYSLYQNTKYVCLGDPDPDLEGLRKWELQYNELFIIQY